MSSWLWRPREKTLNCSRIVQENWVSTQLNVDWGKIPLTVQEDWLTVLEPTKVSDYTLYYYSFEMFVVEIKIIAVENLQ